jgi:hypothetical protein
MSAWLIYRCAIVLTALLILYSGLWPRIEPDSLVAGAAVLACAFLPRPQRS